MSFRVSATMPSIVQAWDQETRRLEIGMFRGMEDGAHMLKERLRDQVRAAGMGERLANTWRDRTYPQRKRASLHPTGFVWSNAPEIISFFNGQTEVVPVNGRRYLAIPSPTARAITGRKGARLPVATVLARLGGKTATIRNKKGHLLILWDARRAAARKRGAHRDMVLLYTLVPTVRSRKVFNVEEAVAAVGRSIPDLIEARLGER